MKKSIIVLSFLSALIAQNSFARLWGPNECEDDGHVPYCDAAECLPRIVISKLTGQAKIDALNKLHIARAKDEAAAKAASQGKVLKRNP